MPIAIVGTGRSGTSMVARMLNLCGVYLGEDADLATKNEWNPKGFWEHAGIYDLNERLFAQLGGSFVEPPLLQAGWEFDKNLDALYDEACDLIERNFGGRSDWGWKLPRTTVTLPFWQRIVPDLRLVVCVRNPMDFAASVEKYYKLTQKQALAVWQYYNFHLLQSSSPGNRFITFYEDYFPGYHAGLDPLLTWLGLPVPQAGGALDHEIAEFHEPGLKHHSTPFDEFILDPQVPYLVKELYMQLLSDNGSADDGLPIVKHAETYLPLLREAITPDSVSHGAALRLKNQVSELERSLDELNKQRRLLDSEKRHLEQILASRTHRIAARVCDFLINNPFKDLLRRSAKPEFDFRPVPASVPVEQTAKH